MESCRFLRPCLQANIRSQPCAAYARFFSASRKVLSDQPKVKQTRSHAKSDFERRIELLEGQQGRSREWYPRFDGPPNATIWTKIEVARKTAMRLSPGTTDTKAPVSVSGRVRSVRVASSKLVFVDIERNGHTIQVVFNLGSMHADTANDQAKAAFRKSVRRGDWLTATGYAHKTGSGEPSLAATCLPKLDSPSLHQIPAALEDAETKARKPHVNMLVDPAELQTHIMRGRIEQHIITWLAQKGYNKVNTPILTSGAGGAVAKPFETVATEMSNTKLNLRIAPELWLKRLIVGGMDKVFELGPAFRNEGVDSTHNPEFTMCEFYATFTTIEALMTQTESLLHNMFTFLANLPHEMTSHLPDSIVHRNFSGIQLDPYFPDKFARLPFIPTLEQAMSKPLPDLSPPTAHTDLLNLFEQLELPLPSNQTVPNLLDALSSHYIEPLCTEPTFITEHPAALSPLSKSFTCPTTGQLISARAELFIEGREYANMYEEENSPFEQRRKFEEQLAYRRQVDPGCEAEVDESYLEVLEWGLPPTGGWGMGIDRLVMLFTGRKRIGDVLPFGTLRNVVGLRGRWRGD
ncbi:Lysine--tRNA ligase, mitochondrial [Elsinoe australis]|uniref:Lysyl-tRNA synthetase n=1 Tax=Elsinoe australis TaxID=40998 RepID=A0A2P7YGD6_9PEZI|nr:Lysine--tRNA ligase, mitochondrial [Elsinoe australis]